MRSERELKEVEAKLNKLTGFIAEFGQNDEVATRSLGFAYDVNNTIKWVLGEITTEQFTSDAYLDVAMLRAIVANIELRTGQILEDYK